MITLPPEDAEMLTAMNFYIPKQTAEKSEFFISDIAKLLSILTRYQKALDECRKQRGICNDTKEHYCRYQKQDAIIQAILAVK